jgi:hypothetical protein
MGSLLMVQGAEADLGRHMLCDHIALDGLTWLDYCFCGPGRVRSDNHTKTFVAKI